MPDENNHPIYATDREIEEAGERRREAMEEAGAKSYRQLRAKANHDTDKPEIRAQQFQVSGGVVPQAPLIQAAPRKWDAFDLASFLPEGRDVPWEEFVQRGIAAGQVTEDIAWRKVTAEGLLTILRANGAVTAYGIPVTVRRLPRPESKPTTSHSKFVPLESIEKPASTSEVAQLRAQVERLERLLRKIESGD